jgi:hypothetical protein
LELSEDGHGLPRYVEEEFRRYLRCGILEEGFARCVCTECGAEVLVAFSCKGKGFCPSCLSRRMSDTAAHLVDRVLPGVRYRQWVLAYPRRLRLALARESKTTRESVTIFLREVFRWERKKARAIGVKQPRVGAISLTQRFGSRLDLNVHHHALLPEGAFTLGEEGSVGFHELERPSREELERILERIIVKTMAMAEGRGLIEAEPCDALSWTQAESVQTAMPFSMEQSEPMEKLSAFSEGFSLEAGAHVHAHDRQGLEHLLRYMLRPPLSLQRLQRRDDGRLQLELKRALYDGTRVVCFTPSQLLKRLAAIVPAPRVHSIRYFGVFAPSSKARPRIVSRGKERRRCSRKTPPLDLGEADGGAEDARLAWELFIELDPLVPSPPPMPERPRRLSWPDLLARVFSTDILRCDKCGGRRRVSAFIPGGRLARQVLDQLGIHERAPPIAKARAPPHQEVFDFSPADGGVAPQYVDAL